MSADADFRTDMHEAMGYVVRTDFEGPLQTGSGGHVGAGCIR